MHKLLLTLILIKIKFCGMICLEGRDTNQNGEFSEKPLYD